MVRHSFCQYNMYLWHPLTGNAKYQRVAPSNDVDGDIDYLEYICYPIFIHWSSHSLFELF